MDFSGEVGLTELSKAHKVLFYSEANLSLNSEYLILGQVKNLLNRFKKHTITNIVVDEQYLKLWGRMFKDYKRRLTYFPKFSKNIQRELLEYNWKAIEKYFKYLSEYKSDKAKVAPDDTILLVIERILKGRLSKRIDKNIMADEYIKNELIKLFHNSGNKKGGLANVKNYYFKQR